MVDGQSLGSLAALPAEGGTELEVVNEFATVVVRKVRTRNGERLEIVSPRLGYTVRLDALLLESLTWQRPESLSRLLEEPFGP